MDEEGVQKSFSTFKLSYQNKSCSGCQKNRKTGRQTVRLTDRRTERQIEDKTTFQLSYQIKSCSECQQDVRKIERQADRQKDFSAYRIPPHSVTCNTN